MKSDLEIKRDVESELVWEPNVQEDDIAVSVNGGVVALSGYVYCHGHKWTAEKAVKRIAGVVAIANDIQVRLPADNQRTDPEIARDAAWTIKHQLPAFSDKVRVIVSEGSIRLEGELEWRYQSAAVENAVKWLNGVKEVSNQIHLKPSVTCSDIKSKIEDAFRRSAEVDSDQVQVDTDDGTVILKGTVNSLLEKKEAERAAWAAPGVVKVLNQITVAV